MIADAFVPATGRRRATRVIAFRIFRDNAKYQVAHAVRSELSCILDLKRAKSFLDSSLHEEHPCQTSVSDVDLQNELGKLA